MGSSTGSYLVLQAPLVTSHGNRSHYTVTVVTTVIPVTVVMHYRHTSYSSHYCQLVSHYLHTCHNSHYCHTGHSSHCTVTPATVVTTVTLATVVTSVTVVTAVIPVVVCTLKRRNNVNLVNVEVAAASTWCMWSCYIFVWLNCISFTP